MSSGRFRSSSLSERARRGCRCPCLTGNASSQRASPRVASAQQVQRAALGVGLSLALAEVAHLGGVCSAGDQGVGSPTLAGVVVAGVLFGVAVDLTDEPIDIDQQQLRAGIPTVAEFDAWRQRELRLATVEGDDAMQAPSTVRFASVVAAGRTRSCTSAIRSRIWPSGWNVGVWSDPGDLFLMGLFVAGSSASRASSSGGHRRCR
jgi:hypothetical protein